MPAPWNLYPARNVDKNGHIEVEYFNLLTPEGTIPLGICNSNMRFFKKLHQRNVRGAFLRLFVWSPTGNPLAPLGSADSLREPLDLVHRFINSIMNLFTQDLVARHPARLA